MRSISVACAATWSAGTDKHRARSHLDRADRYYPHVPLALRAWLRYLVPLTLLAFVACTPMWWLALRGPAPTDVAHARRLMRVAWAVVSTAWIWQLWLVAGVAPAVRSLADGTPLTQLAAFTAGLRGLAVKFIPVVIAILAIALGTLALVVPGILLLVLLATTGAVDSHTDAIAVARAGMKRTALTVAAVIAGALLVGLACQLAIVPAIGKKVPITKLASIRTFMRVLALSLTAFSPLAAAAIAALTARRAR